MLLDQTFVIHELWHMLIVCKQNSLCLLHVCNISKNCLMSFNCCTSLIIQLKVKFMAFIFSLFFFLITFGMFFQLWRNTIENLLYLKIIS